MRIAAGDKQQQPVEPASNPHTRQRRVRHQCQALAGAVVDDRQDPEAPHELPIKRAVTPPDPDSDYPF